MKRGYKILKDAINECPLIIPTLPEKFKKIANSYFPKSVGIEIECGLNVEFGKSAFIINKFKKLNLLDMQFSTFEQNFRLRSGVKGMIELYQLCELMKKHFLFNEDSGIHYHIDMTDCFDNSYSWLENKEILPKLEKWNYTGTYNVKRIRYQHKGSWVNIRPDFKTIEFRIGEMSFDYSLIIKRIMDCQSICKKLKNHC